MFTWIRPLQPCSWITAEVQFVRLNKFLTKDFGVESPCSNQTMITGTEWQSHNTHLPIKISATPLSTVRFHLCNTGKICHLTLDVRESVVHAAVTCRLDMVLSCMHGLPQCMLDQLYSVARMLLHALSPAKRSCATLPLSWGTFTGYQLTTARVQFWVLLHGCVLYSQWPLSNILDLTSCTAIALRSAGSIFRTVPEWNIPGVVMPSARQVQCCGTVCLSLQDPRHPWTFSLRQGSRCSSAFLPKQALRWLSTNFSTKWTLLLFLDMMRLSVQCSEQQAWDLFSSIYKKLAL